MRCDRHGKVPWPGDPCDRLVWRRDSGGVADCRRVVDAAAPAPRFRNRPSTHEEKTWTMTVDILAIAAHRDDVERPVPALCCARSTRVIEPVSSTSLPVKADAWQCGTPRRGSGACSGHPRRDGTTQCGPARRRPVQHRRDPAHRGSAYSPLRASGGDPPLPCRPAPRSPHCVRTRARCVVSRRPRAVSRRRYSTPAAQAALLARLQGGSAQADVRRGHHRPVRAQDAGDPVLQQPVRWSQGGGEIFPTGQDLYSLIEVQNAHYGSLIRTATESPSTPMRRWWLRM